MTKISAVIITLNEEENIERCLSSIADIVDEIIVLDSFSSDSTEEICRSFNVNFYQKEFIDYSSAKNYANSLSKYDYILSIDADEEISPELKRTIQKERGQLTFDGYYVNRRTNYCGQWIRYCGWYPDRKLRLWKRSKGNWSGIVHETLEMSSSNTKLLAGDLLHYSYPTVESHFKRINHFSTLSANELFLQGKKSSVFKMIINPMAKFIKKYFLQLGILEGYYGLTICTLSAYSTFFKYAKLMALTKNE